MAKLALAVLVAMPFGSYSFADEGFVGAVQVHASRVGESDFARIASLGFTGIRVGLRREKVVSADGIFDWSTYDQIVGWAQRYQLTLILTLYDGRAVAGAGESDSWYSYFASFSATAVERYSRAGSIIWEIWNEPNGKSYWPRTPSSDQYGAMVQMTCALMRRVDPEATILAGALGLGVGAQPFDPFIQRLDPLVKNGCLSGVSVHPYRLDAPEGAIKTLAALRVRYPGIRFLITEWGYTSGGRAYNRRTAWVWASRLLLASKLAGSQIGVVYEWSNSGIEPDDREQNFGLVRIDRSATPALAPLVRSLPWLKSAIPCPAPLGPGVYCLMDLSGEHVVRLLVWSDNCGVIRVKSSRLAVFHRFDGAPEQSRKSDSVEVTSMPSEIILEYVGALDHKQFPSGFGIDYSTGGCQ